MKEKASQIKTFRPSSKSNGQWFVLDASGKTLGRLASEIAKILSGKHRTDYSPDCDCGDGVIVLNAERVHLSGNKPAQKLYRYHTGYMSGLREIPFRTMLARKPDYVLEHAVKGMLPRTSLTRQQLKRLRVFAGNQHNMDAQKPVIVNI